MDHLKSLRTRRGLTQSQVAEIIGVSTVTIARYESGEREPSNNKLIQLAEYFNVSIDYLIGKNDADCFLERKETSSLFSAALQQLRKNRRLTQEQVADAIGVQYRTYGSWERGEREPDFAMLCEIADYFGVSTDYLLGRTDILAIKQAESTTTPMDGIERIGIASDQAYELPDVTAIIRAMIADELKRRGL